MQAGLHICDRRLNTSELREQFPDVNFMQIESETDPLWGTGTAREKSESVLKRNYEFMLWLQEQPPGPVVVVTHSAFLLNMFNGVLDCDSALRAWFRTGELRSVIVTSHP